MMLPYVFRLLCLCFACFFVAHAGIGLVVGVGARLALRLMANPSPRNAARWLFTFRILPPAAALAAVTVLCAPSYLWLEPRTSSGEEVGILCLAAALCGTALWLWSLGRGVTAIVRSGRYIRRCRLVSTPERLAGREVWVTEESTPRLMMAGILRPAIVISRRVAESLSPEQLDTAFSHEHAHWAARDNLRRLLLLVAPGLFPGSKALEQRWARAAEMAADDHAVAGDPERCLSLAGALVAVARMGTGTRPHRLATSILGDAQDLAVRVDRLLHSVPTAHEPSRRSAPWELGTGILAFAVAIWLSPAVLSRIHSILERLVH